MRQTTQRKLEATLQRILNEYPTDALQRILSWAVQGRLTHDWGAWRLSDHGNGAAAEFSRAQFPRHGALKSASACATC